MSDLSHLDDKYFIDEYVFNCPYCNRNNVPCDVERRFLKISKRMMRNW